MQIQEREYRLLQLGYIAGLQYEDKMKALKLIQRGADATLLYFWHNVSQGHYKQLPDVVLYKDAHRMMMLYPQFVDEIRTWVNPILSQHFNLQLQDYGYQARKTG